MSSERPFIYRTNDALQNLRLRLTVRQSRSATRDRKDGNEPAQAIKIFKWQEKRFAPWELAKYSHHCEHHDHGDGRYPKDYIVRFRAESGMRQQCLEELEEHGIYLFTYVDKDDIEPEAELQPKTSSVDPDSTVSKSASYMRDRLPSQSSTATGFQVMRVMAAVVTDLSSFTNVLMHSTSQGGSILDLAAGDFSHEGPWRKLRNSNHDASLVQEYVVCTIKSHRGGALEVTPGFSEEEPESDDEGPFRSLRASLVVAEKGPRLTTFSFSSLRVNGQVDRVFQYTLENVNSELDPSRVEELVAAGDKAINRRPSPALNEIVPPERLRRLLDERTHTKPIVHIRVEIVSALGFATDNMYLEYQVVLPAGWCCPDSQATQWHLTEQGERTFQGSTQIATMEELPKGRGGTLMNPAALLEQSCAVAAPTPLGMAVAALLLGLVLGLEHAAAGMCVAALVACVAGYGTSPSSSDESEATAHFGVPVAFSAAPPPSRVEGGLLLDRPPLLLFQASSVDWLGRHRVEGYGSFSLPVQAGCPLDSEVRLQCM